MDTRERNFGGCIGTMGKLVLRVREKEASS